MRCGAGVFPAAGVPDSDLPALAAALLRDYPLSSFPEYLEGDTNFAGWAGEGYGVAVTLAYTLPYNVSVPVAYRAAAQDTIRRRIALGGYRLASLLRVGIAAPAAATGSCPDPTPALAAVGALAGILGTALAAIAISRWWSARAERAGLAQFRDLEELTTSTGVEMGAPRRR